MTHALIEKLTQAIDTKSAEQTSLVLEEIKGTILNDHQLIEEITSPPIIKALHDKLVEEFGVAPRAMMLKGRVQNRARRAVLFTMAMQNGMNKRKSS